MAEGRIYADGLEVIVDTVNTGSGSFSLGGPIAYCDSPEQAKEVAKRCAGYRPLLAACAAAEKQFRFYAEQHSAKGTPDGNTKAQTNREFAERMANAIAAARGDAAHG